MINDVKMPGAPGIDYIHIDYIPTTVIPVSIAYRRPYDGSRLLLFFSLEDIEQRKAVTAIVMRNKNRRSQLQRNFFNLPHSNSGIHSGPP